MDQKQEETITMAIAFAVVIGVELLLHWFLASNATLRGLYLSSKKTNSITGIIDNTIPSAILGLVNGWIGYRWPIRRLCLAAIVFAAGIIGSFRLYRVFCRREHLWWWPLQMGETIFQLATALLVLGLFTYQGSIFAAWRAAGYPKVRP
jgi:hypothetical protein